MVATKKNRGLTEKQEAACQAFIQNRGNKSDAYRKAYNTSKMKPESVNRKAFELFENVKVTARIKQLQEEAAKRNEITTDELLQHLKSYLDFNPKELFNEDGTTKKIHELSDKTAKCLSEFAVDVNKISGNILNIKTKVKSQSKLDTIEKLMKHLGMFKEDNEQKRPVINGITFDE